MLFPAIWLIGQVSPENGTSVIQQAGLIVGLLTGASALFISWRNAKSGATKDYVQGNFETLNGVNERLAKENERLRIRSEEDRLRIIVLTDEHAADRLQIATLTDELADVRKECDECLSRVQDLESRTT